MKSNKIKYRIFRCSKGETVWYEAQYKWRWMWHKLTQQDGFGEYYANVVMKCSSYEDMLTYCTEHAERNRKTIKTLYTELEL